MNQLKALNAEQEKDVERVRQREELLAKVFLLDFEYSSLPLFVFLALGGGECRRGEGTFPLLISLIYCL